MIYKFEVKILYKDNVNDPQGLTISESANRIGFENVKSIRSGKIFILEIESENEEQANKIAEKISDKLCNVKDFELTNHQQFVRNFLSFETPYNSLLLYHGLGTGKTCSAIGVSEEMRTYLKQMNISERIIIVASPNVQENFKMQ